MLQEDSQTQGNQVATQAQYLATQAEQAPSSSPQSHQTQTLDSSQEEDQASSTHPSKEAPPQEDKATTCFEA